MSLTLLQIRYWRVEEPDDVRSTDVLVGPKPNTCPPLNIFDEQRRRRRARSGDVSGAVDDLWPYSTIRAGVLVLNQGSQGELSDTIDFDTPEGGTVTPRLHLIHVARIQFVSTCIHLYRLSPSTLYRRQNCR